MSDEPCLGCRVGTHMECIDPKDHPTEANFYVCCCFDDAPTLESVKGEILGGYKSNDQIRDQTSTGRKRAAALYPITDGMVCEWSRLKFAGGGARPIIGCNGTVIYARKGKGALHHGPDKSTLNNEPGNVHRICTSCHNRWHTLNNPLYAPKRPDAGAAYLPLSGTCLPHDPNTQATDQEIFQNEVNWQLSPDMREVDDDAELAEPAA